MCRLALKTASEAFSPYEVLTAMEAMQEGYDGSGLGLLLRGLQFEDFKYDSKFPILSGIAHTEEAWQRLNSFMQDRGYELKYDHEFETNPSLIEAKDRYRYFLRVYNLPTSFASLSEEEIENELMMTRLALRHDGEEHGGDLTVFSFWPDVATIKEVGWPLAVGDGLGLSDSRILSRVCMAQGRQ
ncbi:MAG: glutamate synthase, partial [Proteobacteria bacterium]|nr:glutamate synthase [Pseudomonadota bacterium]